MNKTELIAFVAKKAGLTNASASSAVEAFLTGVTSTLKTGGKVAIIGWGSFEVTKTKARNGRNPKTGAPLKIPARNNPRFRPGKELKEAVN
ncbi:MAG: HU family DNA-binding protein [Alphaproteobacteria bacterium]|nr:HU family DNA-binding protein [Alphaproteobacteria bacterium]